MKICFKCNCEKPLSEFHKHKGMKDGHLNKCASCVKLAVDEWRAKNPEARKKEYDKRRNKTNKLTRKDYLEKIKRESKGRKAISCDYAHRRRLKIQKHVSTELDNFVFEEAIKLRELRNKSTNVLWHVDHIVPINHKEASGLHNAYNIQVVPAEWNLKKKNRNMEVFTITSY